MSEVEEATPTKWGGGCQRDPETKERFPTAKDGTVCTTWTSALWDLLSPRLLATTFPRELAGVGTNSRRRRRVSVTGSCHKAREVHRGPCRRSFFQAKQCPAAWTHTWPFLIRRRGQAAPTAWLCEQLCGGHACAGCPQAPLLSFWTNAQHRVAGSPVVCCIYLLGSSYCSHAGRGPVIFRKGARDAEAREAGRTLLHADATQNGSRKQTFRRKQGTAHGSGLGTDLISQQTYRQQKQTNQKLLPRRSHQQSEKQPLRRSKPLGTKRLQETTSQSV